VLFRRHGELGKYVWAAAITVTHATQGLITGRTDMYCLDPKRPSLPVKKRIATTQSHEVAHQWFGNIATMEWWDNLYLVCVVSSSQPLTISTGLWLSVERRCERVYRASWNPS
jgi:hypothetical protein